MSQESEYVDSGSENTTLPSHQRILAVLFYFNQETSKGALAKIFGMSTSELQNDIDIMVQESQNAGIQVVQSDSHVSLGTHSQVSGLIQSIADTESSQALSKAAMETLAIVLYTAPVMRAEVDAIRGVNSLYSLRNLLVRGLISRSQNDGQVVYTPTVETYQLLGIQGAGDLPDKKEIDQKIAQVLSAGQEVTGVRDSDKGEKSGVSKKVER